MEKKLSRRFRKFLTILIFLNIIFIITLTTAAKTSNNTPTNAKIIINNSTITTKIQDAINQASSNSIIQLSAGTYTEILTINKPIHLKGEGTTRTHLCATSANNGCVIRITAKGVTLSDLNITNKGSGLYTTCVKITASNTTIQNCTFYDTPIGLAVWSSQNKVSGCEFRNCDDEGIVLLGTPVKACINNTFTSCNFYKNSDGIEFQYAEYNLITSCIFTNNTHTGINAIKSDHNNITFCTFINNQAFDILLTTSITDLVQDSFYNNSNIFIHQSNSNLPKDRTVSIDFLNNSSLVIVQYQEVNLIDKVSQQSFYKILIDKLEQFSRRYYIDMTVVYPPPSNFLLIKFLLLIYKLK